MAELLNALPVVSYLNFNKRANRHYLLPPRGTAKNEDSYPYN
jgi:hypothetical protein